MLIDTLSAPEDKQRANVVDGAHAAADRERHETRLGGAPHHIEHDVAVFVAGGDVEESQLVGAGFVIGDGRFDRIAGVAQIDEVDAFDDAAVFHVKTGNDADLEHRQAACAERMSCRAAAASSLPS